MLRCAEANDDPEPEPATRQARSDRGGDAAIADVAGVTEVDAAPAPAPAPAPTAEQSAAATAGPGKPKKLQMKKGRRVRTTKGTTCHKGLTPAQQATFPAGSKNRYTVYGTVTAGNSKDGYEVKFDNFPIDNRVTTLKSGALTIVRTDENEVEQPGEPEGGDEYEDDSNGPDDTNYQEPVSQTQPTPRPTRLQHKFVFYSTPITSDQLPAF